MAMYREQSTQPSLETKLCPSCQNEIETWAHICPNCMHEWPPVSSINPNFRNKFPCGILSITILFIIIISVIIFRTLHPYPRFAEDADRLLFIDITIIFVFSIICVLLGILSIISYIKSLRNYMMEAGPPPWIGDLIMGSIAMTISLLFIVIYPFLAIISKCHFRM